MKNFLIFFFIASFSMAANAAQGWRCGGTSGDARVEWMVGPDQKSCTQTYIGSQTATIYTGCTACASGDGGCLTNRVKCNSGYIPDCPNKKCVECISGSTQDCTSYIQNATSAQKTCNANGTWDACKATACSDGYAPNNSASLCLETSAHMSCLNVGGTWSNGECAWPISYDTSGFTVSCTPLLTNPSILSYKTSNLPLALPICTATGSAFIWCSGSTGAMCTEGITEISSGSSGKRTFKLQSKVIQCEPGQKISTSGCSCSEGDIGGVTAGGATPLSSNDHCCFPSTSGDFQVWDGTNCIPINACSAGILLDGYTFGSGLNPFDSQTNTTCICKNATGMVGGVGATCDSASGTCGCCSKDFPGIIWDGSSCHNGG